MPWRRVRLVVLATLVLASFACADDELDISDTSAGQSPPGATPGATPSASASAELEDLDLEGRLAFQSDRDGGLDVFVLDLATEEVEKLTDNESDDVHPDWHPEGRSLAFASFDGTDLEIFSMADDGSGIEQLTDNDAYDEHPAWSPDGSKIAFNNDGSGNNDIYVMNADGSGVRRLTSSDANEVAPAWSPDGSQIAFHSVQGQNVDIYKIDYRGGDAVAVTNSKEIDEAFPAWDRELAAVVANAVGNYDIAILNEGAEPELLTRKGASFVAWSPGGRYLAIVTGRDGDSEIHVVDTAGGAEVNVTKDPAQDEHPDWAPAPG